MSTRGSLLIARGRKADNLTFSYPRSLNRAKNFGEVHADAILVSYTNHVVIIDIILCLPHPVVDSGASENKDCATELIDILSNISARRFVMRFFSVGCADTPACRPVFTL